MKTSSVEFIPAHLPLHLWNVIIDGLCCSEKSSSPGSGNEGKREIVLNRRQNSREAYRCVQPKKLKDVLMPVKTMFFGTFRMSRRCLHMMEKCLVQKNYDMLNLCVFVV
ncbi:hypothetical protein TNCV_415361 [Trichonephila clavipes]|nr:hypothetical protein TNCV_415361 [Trichonephila clavipes]